MTILDYVQSAGHNTNAAVTWGELIEWESASAATADASSSPATATDPAQERAAIQAQIDALTAQLNALTNG